jgi:hypothetical protein
MIRRLSISAETFLDSTVKNWTEKSFVLTTDRTERILYDAGLLTEILPLRIKIRTDG